MAALLKPLLTQIVVGAPYIFTPLELFSSGEQGAWYDPSDLTTLYQDSAGTIPVTANGDPVGLMLDKSQGPPSGQLVSNSTFDSGITGWSSGYAGDGGASWTGSAMQVSSNSDGSGNGTHVALPETIPAGSRLRFSFSVANAASDGTMAVRVRVSDIEPTSINSGAQIRAVVSTPTNINNLGTISGIYEVPIDTNYLAINVNETDSLAVVDVDNVEVEHVPGNHATQASSASKPIYRTDGTLHWLEFDGVDDGLLATAPAISYNEVLLSAAYEHTEFGTVQVTMGITDGSTDRTELQATDTNNARVVNTLPTFNGLDVGSSNAGRLVVSNYRLSSGISGRYNGTETASTAASGTTVITSSGSIYVGKSPVFLSNAAGVDVYGMVLAISGKSLTEVQNLESYLATKSGVTL